VYKYFWSPQQLSCYHGHRNHNNNQEEGEHRTRRAKSILLKREICVPATEFELGPVNQKE
jgi:hypothetical protein